MWKLTTLFAFALAIAAVQNALAQSPHPGGNTYVLIPYDQPGGKDPHAEVVMNDLTHNFAAAPVTVVVAQPTDHVAAVANAASICAQYHANGLLVAEGRYEQTRKQSYAVLTTVVRYPAHVEFRLDEIGCDGTVNWSQTTTADRNTSGFSTANVNAVIDDAYNAAVGDATAAFLKATIASAPAPSAAQNAPAPAAPLDPKAKYLVVPFAQPGLADPRAADIMHSFMGKLQARKIDATAAPSMDRLAAAAGAKSLCATSGTSAIIVPWLRIEQSSFSGDSYAELRLDVVNCGGAFMTDAIGTADFKRGTISNYGSTAVAVSEQAMDPALDKLFPQ